MFAFIKHNQILRMIKTETHVGNVEMSDHTSMGRFQAMLTLCLYSSIQTSATLSALRLTVALRSKT